MDLNSYTLVNVKVRLDRAVANEAFEDLFLVYQVENIITTATDHFAILVSLDIVQVTTRQPVLNGFRFEAA
jgi:hypothetical protein